MTGNVQVALLPLWSVAVYITVENPSVNIELRAGLLVNEGCWPELSVAVAGGHVTLVLVTPPATYATTAFGHLITGLMVSPPPAVKKNKVMKYHL